MSGEPDGKRHLQGAARSAPPRTRRRRQRCRRTCPRISNGPSGLTTRRPVQLSDPLSEIPNGADQRPPAWASIGMSRTPDRLPCLRCPAPCPIWCQSPSPIQKSESQVVCGGKRGSCSSLGEHDDDCGRRSDRRCRTFTVPRYGGT